METLINEKFNRSFSSGVAVVPLAVGSLTDRYVGLHAADTPFLRANYSGVSGAFALFWILSERGLFTKHGFER
jgi:hypothetical protein